MFNEEIKEVVGTFVNGTLHGTAKLVLDNENIVIGNFNNGTLHGKLKAHFSKNYTSSKNLTRA